MLASGLAQHNGLRLSLVLVSALSLGVTGSTPCGPNDEAGVWRHTAQPKTLDAGDDYYTMLRSEDAPRALSVFIRATPPSVVTRVLRHSSLSMRLDESERASGRVRESERTIADVMPVLRQTQTLVARRTKAPAPEREDDSQAASKPRSDWSSIIVFSRASRVKTLCAYTKRARGRDTPLCS